MHIKAAILILLLHLTLIIDLWNGILIIATKTEQNLTDNERLQTDLIVI